MKREHIGKDLFVLDSMNAFAHEFRAVYKGKPELAEKDRLWKEAYDKLNEIFE